MSAPSRRTTHVRGAPLRAPSRCEAYSFVLQLYRVSNAKCAKLQTATQHAIKHDKASSIESNTYRYILSDPIALRSDCSDSTEHSTHATGTRPDSRHVHALMVAVLDNLDTCVSFGARSRTQRRTSSGDASTHTTPLQYSRCGGTSAIAHGTAYLRLRVDGYDIFYSLICVLRVSDGFCDTSDRQSWRRPDTKYPAQVWSSLVEQDEDTSLCINHIIVDL